MKISKLKTAIAMSLKNVAKTILPYSILTFARAIWNKINNIKTWKIAKSSYRGSPKSYCPVCQKTGYFRTIGLPPRPKARCLHCGSFERHRLLWLFMQNNIGAVAMKNKKILHVAAEPCLEYYFRKLYGKKYLTADLSDPGAMVKMDITNIQYPDDTFNIIICNHVLEHVIDDLQAMREIYRVLKNNGWAILLAPVADRNETYEDNSIITKEGRLKAFGQEDHVRIYGRDYINRLKMANFNVSVIGANELASDENIKKMSLPIKEHIYYCTKPIVE